ncbi:NAD(P)H-binding protein [Nocardia sp. NPDC003963]
MILVTGATGNIGRALLRKLGEPGIAPVRAFTRDTAAARLPAGVEAVEGDLGDAAALTRALDGVRSMFLLSRLGPDAEILGAARRAGVEHVVLVSSITVQTHPHLGPAAENAAVEKLLETSGLDWTMLRPTQFASNALLWASAVRAHEPVRLPFADTGLPTVHPADIAAVAAAALTGSGHRGQRYAVTGPERISARRQVDTVAALLGRDIELIESTRAQARPGMVAVFGAEAADAVLDVTGGDINDELLRVHDTVTRITGDPALTFRHWAAEHLDAFR